LGRFLPWAKVFSQCVFCRSLLQVPAVAIGSNLDSGEADEESQRFYSSTNETVEEAAPEEVNEEVSGTSRLSGDSPINYASNVHFREQEKINYFRRITAGEPLIVSSSASANDFSLVSRASLSVESPRTQSSMDSTLQYNGVPFAHAHAMYREQ
jgi:hypothetical protein